ncbi:hypothetical protein PIB30_079321 [Stylosanthes scabra]|uniref:F-box associated beta-propeller type 1 domain-containing protein n=1 Tax=Stylosanthes scabra TaxID=79078 RepID=A0ABU6SSD6_9FABA|nr:hypothetical protein [Stylosanthes scabra]
MENPNLQLPIRHQPPPIAAAEPTLSEPRMAYPRWWHKFNQFGDFSVRSVFENPFTKGVCFEGKRDYNIIGSCNGLLCLVNDNVSVMLWNPCTGLTSQELEFEGLLNVCGFGYDHVNDNYKLVGIVNEEKKQKPHKSATRIYTFGTNSSWRKIQDITFDARWMENREGVFVPGTGTLNWVVPCGAYPFDPLVLSLDLGKETHSLFSLPHHKDMYYHLKTLQLRVLRNYLAVCFDHRKTHCEVWLMKEYGDAESWTKLAMIPQYLSIHVLPLYLWEDDVLLGTAAPYSRIIRYNLNHCNFKFPVIESDGDDMMKVAPLSKHSMAMRFHIYHESLVSPSHCGLLSSRSEMRWIKVIKNPCLQAHPSEFLQPCFGKGFPSLSTF